MVVHSRITVLAQATLRLCRARLAARLLMTEGVAVPPEGDAPPPRRCTNPGSRRTSQDDSHAHAQLQVSCLRLEPGFEELTGAVRDANRRMMLALADGLLGMDLWLQQHCHFWEEQRAQVLLEQRLRQLRKGLSTLLQVDEMQARPGRLLLPVCARCMQLRRLVGWSALHTQIEDDRMLWLELHAVRNGSRGHRRPCTPCHAGARNHCHPRQPVGSHDGRRAGQLARLPPAVALLRSVRHKVLHGCHSHGCQVL